MLDAALPTGRRLLLIIDRLEELFTLTAIHEDGQLFADALAALVSTRGDRAWVVSTMRAEFYPNLSVYSELGELASQHQVFLSRLVPEEVEELIEAPAMQLSGRATARGKNQRGRTVADIRGDSKSDLSHASIIGRRTSPRPVEYPPAVVLAQSRSTHFGRRIRIPGSEIP